MPGGDRTGPRGFGPMTGRRAGYCAGYDMPDYTDQVPGYGMRSGGRFGNWGWGRGWRHWYHATGLPGWARAGAAPVVPEHELAGLKNAAEWLKGELDAINRRIEELEKKE